MPKVGVDGTSLTLDGRKWWPIGINAYQLGTNWDVNAGCGAQVDGAIRACRHSRDDDTGAQELQFEHRRCRPKCQPHTRGMGFRGVQLRVVALSARGSRQPVRKISAIGLFQFCQPVQQIGGDPVGDQDMLLSGCVVGPQLFALLVPRSARQWPRATHSS
jgi:hypothetical protein